MDPRGPGAKDEIGARPREGPRPARAFLIVGGLGALLFAALTPPLGNPDEATHLARAYLISEGHFAVPGRAPHATATVPRSLSALDDRVAHKSFRGPPRRFRPAEIRALFAQPLAPQQRLEAGYLGTYGPVAYAPQALALLPARLAGAPPVALLYLGRLGNVALYLLAGWLALRLAPRRRLALALVLLVPMNVAQAASLSADVPTHALALLFTALCWRLALTPGLQVTRRDALALAALAGLLGLAKPGYWLLVGLLALIPAARFGSAARRRAVTAASAAALLVPSLLWLAAAVAADPPAGSPHADLPGQLAHLRADPWSFLAVLRQSFWPHSVMAFYTGVGVLGHVNVVLPTLVYVTVPLAVGVAILSDDRAAPPLRARDRALLLAIFAGTGLILLSIAYVAWNPVGAPVVIGVQGRYYAPVVPLVLLAIPPLLPPGRVRESLRSACLLASALCLAIALQTLLAAFYA